MKSLTLADLLQLKYQKLEKVYYLCMLSKQNIRKAGHLIKKYTKTNMFANLFYRKNSA